MVFERSKLLIGGDSAVANTPAGRRAGPAALGAASSGGIAALHAAELELEHLRATNARLRRELAALQLREAEALRLADRDGLTGLYNRRRMLELLNLAIADARERKLIVGLLFIDLNGFKAVNDFYGHAAGDRILTTVATRMSARVRTGDIVCRLGGDEFVVVLPNLPDPASLTRIAEARSASALPCRTGSRAGEQHLSAAVEAMYPRDGADAESLLNRADETMYRVKNGAARAQGGARDAATPQRLCRRRDDKG